MELDLMVPSDLKCDATKQRGDQIKIAGSSPPR
jgi:hypothetical protein